MPLRINPSILAADFANFDSELQRIATADFVHVDVMDGHFVRNLTFGLPMVTRLAQVSPIPLDVHLMIEEPEYWAPLYAAAGASSVTFPAENVADPVSLAARIRDLGVRAGVAVKPATPIEPFLADLEAYDVLLIMTVEPGFGGQPFMMDMMPKLASAAEAVAASGRDIWLQVDGGITAATAPIALAHGADTFVAGSSVYSPDAQGVSDPAARIAELRAALAQAGTLD